MRPVGFSTGALAAGDYVSALSMLRNLSIRVVEVSALRAPELPRLAGRRDELAQLIDGFTHVSIHAPSRIPAHDEREVIRMLLSLGHPVVVHPDAIHTPRLWTQMSDALLVENMDKRKPIGRTAAELREIFTELPGASLCLDLAHARQVDPTMIEARKILMEHGSRLRQVHISEVGTSSRHTAISFGAIDDYQRVGSDIPAEVPIIVESPASAGQIMTEIRRVHEALGNAETSYAARA
jgi:hypothetical protein